MFPPHNRVLVIDDEPSIHTDFRSILAGTAQGEELAELESALFDERPPAAAVSFVVDSAMQGEEGLDRARSAASRGEPFSVAFVDMRMPQGWDGLRTVKELWAEDPRLQVVICTAYSDHSWGEVLSEIDSQDRLLVIKKPFDPIEVSVAAATLSAKWKRAREMEARIEMLERSLELERKQSPGPGPQP
jgi:CheY-like chemotaxis protein